MTVKLNKYLCVVFGLMLVVAWTQSVRASSCDIQDVCAYVEVEKKKLESSSKSKPKQGEETSENSEVTSELPADDGESENSESGQESIPKGPTSAAVENIEDACGIGEEVLDSKCPLELVVKYCWQQDTKFAVKNCKSNH